MRKKIKQKVMQGREGSTAKTTSS
ncbi:uncharacterized protein G2W53_041368 [Senna tora]|uniref:Uncharacterized protein n=1 Tax=Senna tora TaxID=362788 RepID=A0A834SFE3_9FABA|nr:uncharacterized protein G2W53_041368 [Senna tora]